MYRGWVLGLFSSTLILVTACDPPAQQQPNSNSQAQIEALEQKMRALSDQVADQKATIEVLKSAEALDRAQLDGINSTPAWLDTDTHNYNTARNQFGTFPISIEKIEPYLDGYKVSADIGNLTSSTFSGAKVTLGWGASSKEFDLTTDFYPDRWTQVELVATPAKASDMKLLTVGVAFDVIRMGAN